MSITLFFPGNAAIRILEHETTFRLVMVTAPMRRLPTLTRPASRLKRWVTPLES